MAYLRRPCSDSRHVTAPYKLSFFIIIIITMRKVSVGCHGYRQDCVALIALLQICN